MASVTEKRFSDCLFCKGATPPPGARCKGGCGNATLARHECHAEGCTVPVPPRMLMCGPHWAMVPHLLKKRVWSQYRVGQEVSKDPTREYVSAVAAAIRAVAQKEGR